MNVTAQTRKLLKKFAHISKVLTTGVFILQHSVAPTYAVEVELSYAISNGANDSRVLGGGSFNSTETTMQVGKSGSNSFENLLLFDGIEIPAGSTINSAHLEITTSSGGGNTVNLLVSAIANPSAVAPIDATTFNTIKTNRTTAEVVWNNLQGGGWGQTLESPDLTAIVTEMVNNPGWDEGDNIMIYLGDNGSDSSKSIFTGDFTGAEPKPTLVINYEFINSPPDAVDDEVTTRGQANISVLDNDSDANGHDLTITAVTQPDNGSVTNSDPLLIYIPDSDFAGVDTFTYTISDGTDTDTATVEVTVLENSIYYSYQLGLDYTNVPDLYYDEVTIGIDPAGGEFDSIYEDGVEVNPTLDEASGHYFYTTTSQDIEVYIKDPPDPDTVSIYKAALKDGKYYAWSHGMDDNTYLEGQIALIQAKGWRAGVNIITDLVDDNRDEDWILDKIDLIDLVEQEWAVGNHTSYNQCDPADPEEVILNGYNRLSDIALESNNPSYKIIGFAAPCFSDLYDPYINNMIANDITEVKYNQSQGSTLMILDVGASNYTAGSYTATSMNSSTKKFGRDISVETAPNDVIAQLDWMDANATVDRHFWKNTLSHGGQDANLSPILDHAYDNYGPGGNDKLWFAPTDEIFSYLLVRDNTELTVGNGVALNDGDDPAISTVSATPSNSGFEVEWSTDKQSTTLVRYGLTSNLTAETAEKDIATKVTNHTESITGLSSCTKYFYQVVSTDEYEATGEDQIRFLITGGCKTGTTVGETIEDQLDRTEESVNTLTMASGDFIEITTPIGYSSQNLYMQIIQLDGDDIDLDVVSDSYLVFGNHYYLIKFFSDADTPVTNLDLPVQLRILFSNSELAGLDPDTIDLFHLDGSTWEPLNCEVTDSEALCEADSFSDFALAAQSLTGGDGSGEDDDDETPGDGSDNNDEEAVEEEVTTDKNSNPTPVFVSGSDGDSTDDSNESEDEEPRDSEDSRKPIDKERGSNELVIEMTMKGTSRVWSPTSVTLIGVGVLSGLMLLRKRLAAPVKRRL